MRGNAGTYDDACGAIVFAIACSRMVDAEDLEEAFDDLGLEERDRLARALVTVGALDAKQALALLRDAAREDERAAAEVAGRPVGEALT